MKQQVVLCELKFIDKNSCIFFSFRYNVNNTVNKSSIVSELCRELSFGERQ